MPLCTNVHEIWASFLVVSDETVSLCGHRCAQADLMAAKDQHKTSAAELLATQQYISQLHGSCDFLLVTLRVLERFGGVHVYRD